jgi:hypothetical protein
MVPQDIAALAAAYGAPAPTPEPAVDTRAAQREIVAGGVDIDKMVQLDNLKQRKRDHESAADALGEEIAALEAELLEQFALSGEHDKSLPTGRRGSPRCQIWGSRRPEVTDAEYFAAFAEAGEDWAVLVRDSVNARSLASKIKELDETGMAGAQQLEALLPEPIRRVIAPVEKWSIGFNNISNGSKGRRLPQRTGE